MTAATYQSPLAISFSGVDQTSPLDSQAGRVVTGAHSAQSDTVATIADGAWVVDAIAAPTLPAAGAGQITAGATTYAGVSVRGPVTPAGPAALSWTWPSNSAASAHSLVALKPAP